MERFKQLGEQLSNWGRWGPDDERGTLNLITAARLARAGSLVRHGRVFSLSLPVGSAGPQTGSSRSGRINPIHLVSVLGGDLAFPEGMEVSDDWLILPLQAGTQWDGLGHIGYDGRLYNDVPSSSIRAMGGARRLGIERIADGVAGRGVLLDVARLRGVDWLAAGEAITVADLEAAEHRQGVTAGPGDILLLRTGWWEQFETSGDGTAWREAEPGLTLETAGWLKEREIAAVAVDNWGVEMIPSGDPEAFMPLHCVLIRDMGMTLGEMFVLGALAADCAQDGVWEFLLCAAPLRVQGGLGSPVNPLAIK
jgi:kynurenine formamidase